MTIQYLIVSIVYMKYLSTMEFSEYLDPLEIYKRIIGRFPPTMFNKNYKMIMIRLSRVNSNSMTVENGKLSIQVTTNLILGVNKFSLYFF